MHFLCCFRKSAHMIHKDNSLKQYIEIVAVEWCSTTKTKMVYIKKQENYDWNIAKFSEGNYKMRKRIRSVISTLEWYVTPITSKTFSFQAFKLIYITSCKQYETDNRNRN